MRYIRENPRRPIPLIGAYALLVLGYLIACRFLGARAAMFSGLVVLLLPVPLSVYCHYYVKRKNGTALFDQMLAISGIVGVGCFFLFGHMTLRPRQFDLGGAFVSALIGGTLVCGMCMIAGAVAELFFARRRRFVTSGFCSKCNYDLTGNVSGRCPECGTWVGDLLDGGRRNQGKDK
jgi:hypothetical protein